MDLIALIENPELMNRTTLAELQALVDEFPCMQAARLLLVENAFRLGESDYRTEAEKAAVLIPDRKVLFDLTEGMHLHGQDEANDDTAAEETNTPTGTDLTSTMIDRFLFGDSEDRKRRKKPSIPPPTTWATSFKSKHRPAHPARPWALPPPPKR